MNSKRIIIPTILLLLVLIIAGPVAAQEDASATLTPVDGTTSVTVGDPILFALNVQHPAGTQVIMPDISENWGDFTIAAIGTPETVTAADGSKMTTFILDTRLFAPGDFQTPPLVLSLADTAGHLSSIDVPSVPVAVQSVLVEGDTELRDIKPPVDLAVGNIFLMFLCGLFLVGISTMAAWRLWRNGRILPAPVDNRPAYVIALEELDKLEQQNLPAQRQFKPYYTAIADVLRRFIGREYGIAVQERTTTEIEEALQHRPLSKEMRLLFISLLHQCDLVKFADSPSSPGQAATIMIEIRQAIQTTQTASFEESGRATYATPILNLNSTQMEVQS